MQRSASLNDVKFRDGRVDGCAKSGANGAGNTAHPATTRHNEAMNAARIAEIERVTMRYAYVAMLNATSTDAGIYLKI